MNLAAAVLAAALTLGPAGHTPPPPSTVSTPSGLCLTAARTVTAAPAMLKPCDPPDAAQQWAFTPKGRFRLHGTSEYLAAGPTGGMVLGPWPAALSWNYTRHRLAAGGEWLTWCESAITRQPWLQAPVAPDCQAFYVFTEAPG